jgi:hypothetical protein
MTPAPEARERGAAHGFRPRSAATRAGFTARHARMAAAPATANEPRTRPAQPARPVEDPARRIIRRNNRLRQARRVTTLRRMRRRPPIATPMLRTRPPRPVKIVMAEVPRLTGNDRPATPDADRLTGSDETSELLPQPPMRLPIASRNRLPRPHNHHPASGHKCRLRGSAALRARPLDPMRSARETSIEGSAPGSRAPLSDRDPRREE